jgi:ATP-dependent helicase/DNAse subunit B
MGLAEALFRHDEEWFQSQERLKNHFAPLFNDWVRRDDFSDVLHAASTPDGAFFKDPAILESLKQDSSDFSATRFEVYTTCAFKHFCDYTLALEEPLESRVWAEMGSILHRVLEEFFRELPESRRRDPGYWAETAKVRERLLRKLGHVTQAGFFPNEPLYRRKVYLESMRRALATFAESEAQLFQKRELEPAYFEWEFGKKEPRVIDGVPVKGQIDRIDLTADKKQAFIIDYKLSRRPVSLSEKFDKGLEMQLPLYLLAAQRFLGAEGIGAELRFLRTGDKEGVYRESARKLLGLHPNTRVLSEENWEEMLRTARKSMRDAATRFHAGDISIRSKSCRNCAYNSVCRFEPWKIVYAGEAS